MERNKNILIITLLVVIVFLLSIILLRDDEPKIVYRPAPETENRSADGHSNGSAYTRNQVRNTITKKWREMQTCYNRFLDSTPNPEVTDGRIKVDWRVTAEGKMLSPEVVASDLHHAILEGCLLSRIETWQFPPPLSGRETYVVYKFTFKKTK
ncbi:MAG: AgmX/PglI C-terminal domain-containing protein [Proteobacteria bacterium]|nr:AgmX/PglI C-terminal domain-containing protein [Pseudomonadota bacterium]